jgi:hypothetical protein
MYIAPICYHPINVSAAYIAKNVGAILAGTPEREPEFRTCQEIGRLRLGRHRGRCMLVSALDFLESCRYRREGGDSHSSGPCEDENEYPNQKKIGS